eukprot:GILK01004230.1.p1 GENE.GILK01004230.1~~GILK01004230.1.p1  ORF type:complete len:250 (+),score=58.44 GILK01004230.1:84-752(+)
MAKLRSACIVAALPTLTTKPAAPVSKRKQEDEQIDGGRPSKGFQEHVSKKLLDHLDRNFAPLIRDDVWIHRHESTEHSEQESIELFKQLSAKRKKSKKRKRDKQDAEVLSSEEASTTPVETKKKEKKEKREKEHDEAARHEQHSSALAAESHHGYGHKHKVKFAIIFSCVGIAVFVVAAAIFVKRRRARARAAASRYIAHGELYQPLQSAADYEHVTRPMAA